MIKWQHTFLRLSRSNLNQMRGIWFFVKRFANSLVWLFQTLASCCDPSPAEMLRIDVATCTKHTVNKRAILHIYTTSKRCATAFVAPRPDFIERLAKCCSSEIGTGTGENLWRRNWSIHRKIPTGPCRPGTTDRTYQPSVSPSPLPRPKTRTLSFS